MSKRTALGRSLLRQQMGFDLSGWIAVRQLGREGNVGIVATIYPYADGSWGIVYDPSREMVDSFASPNACLREIARELKRRKKAAAA